VTGRAGRCRSQDPLRRRPTTGRSGLNCFEKSVRADEPFHDPQLDVQDQAVTVASTESRLPPAVHKSLPELGPAFPAVFIAILRPNALDRPVERKEGVKRKRRSLNSRFPIRKDREH